MYVDRHHVVPKFLGGTDDESNLVRLPRWAHQEIHYRRWIVHGYIQDLHAAKMLGMDLSTEDQHAIYEENKRWMLENKDKLTQARLNSEKWWAFRKDPEYLEKMKESSKQCNIDGKINSPETRKLISKIKQSVPNHNSKPICVNGVIWGDSAKCVRGGGSDGLTLHQLRYRVKNPNYLNIYYVNIDEQH